MSWVDYNDDIDRLSTELIELEAKKADLEFQVESLRAGSLNRDLLDQKAREYVYASGTKEMTIWLDP